MQHNEIIISRRKAKFNLSIRWQTFFMWSSSASSSRKKLRYLTGISTWEDSKQNNQLIEAKCQRINKIIKLSWPMTTFTFGNQRHLEQDLAYQFGRRSSMYQKDADIMYNHNSICYCFGGSSVSICCSDLFLPKGFEDKEAPHAWLTNEYTMIAYQDHKPMACQLVITIFYLFSSTCK